MTVDSKKAKGEHPKAHAFDKEDEEGDYSPEGEESQTKRMLEGTTVGWLGRCLEADDCGGEKRSYYNEIRASKPYFVLICIHCRVLIDF